MSQTTRLLPARIHNALVPEAIERKVSDLAIRTIFGGLDTLGLMDAGAPRGGDIQVERDLRYGPDDADHHRLDVLRPAGGATNRACVLYIHGGGFRILSKETHHNLARIFARRGLTTVNLNYRLAPEHPYPAALADVGQAYRWVVEHADELGIDADKIVVTGESAGANLVASLVAMACWRGEEPWARSVFELGVPPALAIPTCGMLQVSDPLRIERRKTISPFVRERLLEAARAYLDDELDPEHTPLLADPVRFFEQARQPDRPLPPIFAAVGTRDPLLDDTRRLARAVRQLGGRCTAHYYPSELHSFHALMWRDNARQYWRDAFDFIERGLDAKMLRDHALDAA